MKITARENQDKKFKIKCERKMENKTSAFSIHKSSLF